MDGLFGVSTENKRCIEITHLFSSAISRDSGKCQKCGGRLVFVQGKYDCRYFVWILTFGGAWKCR